MTTTKQKDQFKKLPSYFLFIIVAISLLPFLLNLLGIDFSEMAFHSKASLSAHSVSDQHFYILKGAFTHTILEWSACMLAFLTCTLAFSNYVITKDPILPVIGVALLCAGAMDVFHTLAADRLIEAVAPNQDFIPFTWAICRLFNALICLIGISFVLYDKKYSHKKSLLMISLISLLFIAMAYLITHFSALSSSLPQTQFKNSFITRPWDVAPFFIFLLTGLGYFKHYQKKTSPFIHALLLSTIPNVATQIHMGLGSSYLFDNHFFIAHFLKIISYGVPFIGLLYTYILNSKEKDFFNRELNELQEVLDRTALISETNEKGLITKANDKFLETSKYNLNEIIGKTHAVIKSQEHSRDFFAHMWKTITSGNIWTGDIKNRAKDGSYYWVATTIYPKYNFSRKINGFTSIRYDITRKKEQDLYILRSSKEQKIFNTLLTIDRSTNISLADKLDMGLRSLLKISWLKPLEKGGIFIVNNDELELFTKIGLGEEIESKCSKVKKGKCLCGLAFELQEVVHASCVDKRHTTNFPSMKSHGHYNVPIVEKLQVIGVIVLYLPHGHEKNENEISFLKSCAEIFSLLIVSDRNESELIVSRDKALAAEKAKADFLANMSHEIRTPLNGVLGTVALLNHGELNEEQRNGLDTIEKCGNHLLSLLNDILDLSKIDSGRLELELISFNINQYIEDAISLCSSLALKKDLKIRYKKPMDKIEWFKGDPTKIRQIIVNFLSNAIKFTEKGEVVISLIVKKQKDQLFDIFIHVKDTGIGIPQKSQHKLFQDFTQADNSTTRKYGGSGLGLSICKKLAQIMGGKVGFKSSPGIGSDFYLEIPLKQGINKNIAKNNELKDDLPQNKTLPYKLLLVEDNIINQKIAQAMLKKLGYTYDLANNGLEALKTLESKGQNYYTAILMDLQMPEMDGITATKKIVTKYGLSRPKIIAMTANVFLQDKKNCFNAGMDDFVEKPILIENLKHVLKKYRPSEKNDQQFSQKKRSTLFDKKSLDDSFSQDLEILTEICEDFYIKSKENILELNSSCEANNFSKLELISHTLKGLCALFCANELKEKAQEIEILAKSNKLPTSEALSHFTNHIDILSKQLKEAYVDHKKVA